MKCAWTEKKKLTAMLIAGLALAAIGAVMGYMTPEEAHTMTKIAGLISGIGSAFALMGGVLLLRAKRRGEAQAKDDELTFSDERGMAVAYKAQSVTAIVAIVGIVAIMLAALLRGDTFYLALSVALCFAVAAAKMIALYAYNRMM